jgi:hypothetical protein
MSSRVKWIVSSRNWPHIEERLETAEHRVRLCLELNAKSISAAVSIYIQNKVAHLAQLKEYNNEIRDAAQRHLSSNANDTFLWVALVCQKLKTIYSWATIATLDKFPPGLDPLYQRMTEYIDAMEDKDNIMLCRQVLAIAATVYRSITLPELASFVEMPSLVGNNLKAQETIIGLCGSFLTLRDRTVYFVHQSAKDFLLKKASCKIYPFNIKCLHYNIFSQSLQILSRTLHRNMYSLRHPGVLIGEVEQPTPDPLAQARYSCVYWVDHLHDCDPVQNAANDLQHGGSVDKFLRRSYLYWLEALSLLRSMSEGVLSMAKLDSLLQVRPKTLAKSYA